MAARATIRTIGASLGTAQLAALLGKGKSYAYQVRVGSKPVGATASLAKLIGSLVRIHGERKASRILLNSLREWYPEAFEASKAQAA